MQISLSSVLAISLAGAGLAEAGSTLPSARRPQAGKAVSSASSSQSSSSTTTSSSTSLTSSRTALPSIFSASTSQSTQPSTSSRASTSTSSSSRSSSLVSTSSSTKASSTSASTSTGRSSSSISNAASSSTSAQSTTSSRTTSTTSSSASLVSTTTSTTTTKASSTTTTTSSSAACTTPVKGNGKRGLSYNDPKYTNQYSLCGSNSKISWTYNWASDPYFPYSWGSSTYNTALTFVPMLWSNANDLTSVWANNIANAKSKYGADALLAFNEPDGCDNGGSCMSVADSVSAYKQYIQPYAGQYQLGAPAVTNSQSPGHGLDYLKQFIGNCTGCTIDFIPIHFYGDVNTVSQFTDYVQSAYSQFNKPIWITEFGTNGGTPVAVQNWLGAATIWLDSQSYVKRYAYFMNAPNSDDTWLIGQNGSMNGLGMMYNS